MTIQILGSDSSGNAYVLEDVEGNQLLLECGIKYEKICEHIDFERLDCVVISHEKHRDHSLSMKDFEEACIDIYSPLNLKDIKIVSLDNWNIVPFPCTHNVECFGYIIHNKAENKSCIFATDTTSLPQIADRPFDCMMFECNYNYDKVIENSRLGKLNNDGYKNHMALEVLVEWLKTRHNKPKHLVAIHLSNNGNIDKELAINELKQYGENVCLAKKGVKIEI